MGHGIGKDYYSVVSVKGRINQGKISMEEGEGKDKRREVLDFIKNEALRKWVMRSTIEGGFASHEDFIEHLVDQVYTVTGGYLGPKVRLSDTWSRQVEDEWSGPRRHGRE